MIEINNLTKIYKTKKGVSTTALNNVDLKINDKGMVFIVGTSGSGKSTLLNLIGGLDSIDSGTIIVDGKDISKFKSKEYDSYRNGHIGFIFQEFNVLENLTVYENIEISLKLQNIKDTSSKVEDVLNKLNISELKNRKMNELSGGQKQRVAIARALIKNPNIILADEPTGNLDSKNSEQIFNILKEISKNHLVLIVSHDKEAANKYANHIIQIEDGKIISDTYKEEKNEKKEIRKITSKLPDSYGFKLAIANIKAKPFKLIMTIILLSMSFAFMGFTINIALFDEKVFLTNTMKDNNNYNYEITKTELNSNTNSRKNYFNKDDIEYIKKITKKDLNLGYFIYNNGTHLNFEFGEFKKSNMYYDVSLQSLVPIFVELNSSNLVGKIIGNIPKNNNEILVHKYFADFIMQFGIKLYDGKLYKPNGYQDIIDEKKEVKLGNNKVIISGIIDDKNDEFLKFKNIASIADDDKKLRTDNLYFRDNYTWLSRFIYVKNFVEAIKLENNKDNFINKIHLSNNLSDNVQFLDKKVTILTSNGKKFISSLKKDEIIISHDYLTKTKTYIAEFNEYLKKNKNRKYEDLVNEFSILYLKKHSFNNQISLFISTDDEYMVTNNLKIVGVSLDETSYISKIYYDEYIPVKNLISTIFINDRNIHNLKNSFSKMTSYVGFMNATAIKEGKYYLYDIEAGEEEQIGNIVIQTKNSLIFAAIISGVFVIFSFLLFTNFISVSIMYAKKEIGTLKALGTKNSDVLKIFAYESTLLALVSYILSIILIIVVFYLLNNHYYGYLLYKVRGYFINPFAIILLLLFVLGTALAVTTLAIEKVVKIKPIDAILNK